MNINLEMQAQNQINPKQGSDEKIESLLTTVKQLPPERRALLELRYHEGFDIAQIAKILDVPEGTVKSRLHRLLEQLRQIVERNRNE